MQHMKQTLLALILGMAGVLALAGCSTTGQTPAIRDAIGLYYEGHHEQARQIFTPLAQKTNEDYVLNNVRLGSVELAQYDLEAAERSFYRAYEVMNSVQVNDGGRTAGAVLVSEKLKIWKGEPFERAMANFYLGMLYYIKKDYANARAAFENALFKLRDYGEKNVQEDKYAEMESDFTIAYLMLGRCWMKLGDAEKAAWMFNRAAQLRGELGALADMKRQQDCNVLLVVDFGQGPRKILQHDNSIVNFDPHPSQVPTLPTAQVAVDGRAISARGLNVPPIDLVSLAHQRQWQDIDTIRLVKSAVGTGLMAGGAYAAARGAHKGNNDNVAAGLGMIAAGALLKASATADLRHWEMLPRTVYIIPLVLSPGKHTIQVSFGDRLSQTWRGVEARDGGETTLYMRISPWDTAVREWGGGEK